MRRWMDRGFPSCFSFPFSTSFLINEERWQKITKNDKNDACLAHKKCCQKANGSVYTKKILFFFFCNNFFCFFFVFFISTAAGGGNRNNGGIIRTSQALGVFRLFLIFRLFLSLQTTTTTPKKNNNTIIQTLSFLPPFVFPLCTIETWDDYQCNEACAFDIIQEREFNLYL